MTKIKKPVPIIDGDSRVFWDGCYEGKLMIQKCTDCKCCIFYPRAVCPHCMSDKIEWIEASGKGKIYSYTISRRGASPAFEDDAPYVVALIELDEGVRMLSNIVNCSINDVCCNMSVKVIYEDHEEIKLPKFQPV